jgi:hypothetical protein
MQKQVTIITIVLVSLVFLGSVLGVYLMTSASYNTKAAALTKEIDSAQKELDTLKADKDKNGFTPTEVTKAFFVEVKSDSMDKAKLYLAPEVQNMDIVNTLKLGADLANITTGDNLEESNGDAVNVSMTFVMSNDETTVRVFTLSKYDDAWKITGVTAE